MNRPKVKGEISCIYCNAACDPEKDEFVITRRKTINWFHKKCYHVYKTIGFNLVDGDNKDV